MSNDQYAMWKPLKFFLGYAKKHKWRFALSFALMPITASLVVAGPALVKKAIDEGVAEANYDLVVQMGLFYLFVLLANVICSAVQNMLLQSGGIRTVRDLRKAVVERVSRMTTLSYESRPTGVYINRATSDIDSIGETFLQGVSYIITDSLNIVFIFIFLFTQSVSLALITLIILPVVYVIVNFFRLRLRRVYAENRKLNGRMTTAINETVEMLPEISAFELAAKQKDSFHKESRQYRDSVLRSVSMEASVYSILEGLVYVVIGAVLLVMVWQQEFFMALTLGSLVAWILLLPELFNPLKEMGSRFAILQSAFAALDKIQETHDYPQPPVGDQSRVKELQNSQKKDFVLKNLRFAYPKGSEVLKGIDLHIPQASSLGVVGPTGGGKSTLIKILCRLQFAEPGMLAYAGIDMNDVDSEFFKKELVFVPQEPSIFTADLFYNISLGREGLSEEDVLRIAQEAKLMNFIESQPQGLQTPLRAGGPSLSVGQKQILALLRALLSEAKVMVLDEATANMDSESEQKLQEAIKYAMRDRTVIVIAHRLSTVRDCERIAVLREGHVDFCASHEELLDTCEYYRALYQWEEKKRNIVS